MILCGIGYHLFDLINVKNTHGKIKILVKLQASAPMEVSQVSVILYMVPNGTQSVTSFKSFKAFLRLAFAVAAVVRAASLNFPERLKFSLR